MWYLVVPPIVVVVSLSFLVWYLSRKGSDPVIAQRVLESEQQETISFPRTKEFFLRILEKSGQQFKVRSLRAHNMFNEFTRSVRASRLRVHTTLTSGGAETKAVFREEVIAPQEKVLSHEEESFPPVVSPKEDGMFRQETLQSERPLVPPRPMISEVATHPEKRKRSLRPNAFQEEELIARIAKDPKDFTAYEELGDYYLDRENIKDAKECYRQVLKLSPVHRMVKIKIRRLEKLLTKAGE